MAWEHIPNEVVKAFTGIPLMATVVDGNLEEIYKPMLCPGKGPLTPEVVCTERFTTISAYSDHLMAVHGYPGNMTVMGQPVQEEATVARLLMQFLMRFNNENRENPLRLIRKTNDSHHSQETWRRAFLALNGKPQTAEVRLKKAQYDWLQDVLDRKLPISDKAKTEGEEQQTVGLYIFGGSEDSVRQAFKTPEDRLKAEAARKKLEPEEPDEPEDVPLSLVAKKSA